MIRWSELGLGALADGGKREDSGALMPTWRLYAALLVAAPFGALGGPFVLLALAIGAIAILAAAVDWQLAGDGRRLRVERRLASDKLSLGDWNLVELQLANRTSRSQRVRVREQPPTGFGLDVAAPMFEARLPPRGDQTLSYHVRPPHRGDGAFGHVYVRVEGPLGLVRRTFRQVDTARAVRVYPNLRELRRYDLLVRRGLETQAAGRPVRVAGASTEFERIREYLPDDEFRRINWKATARRGQPLVNQFEAERSQNLVMLLDAGRSMAALADPPGGDEGLAVPSTSAKLDRALSTAGGRGGFATPSTLTKLDRALNTALLLAYVASQRGDRVALLAYADDVRAFMPPRRGRAALLTCVQTLYNLRAEPIEPDHGRAFAFLAQRNLRRSLVVLFTDLSDRESSSVLAAHVLRAARQHMVVCVTLADPNVRRPALARPTDGRSLYEKMVAQQLLDDRAAVLASLAARGVLTVDTDAASLNPRVISAYLELKQRG
ncbi:MAG: DUF58 domain-containing protein, partial [Chloroflexi bacterium]|nr:DUF58 domain-containing protein [Chloroflexota bacterium]